MATRIATIIGNGESRSGFDITSTQHLGMTVGCNAVYRDMTPNYMVCADRKLITELLREKDNKVPYPLYTRPQWIKSFPVHKFLEMPELPYKGKDRIDEPFHWGTGQFATLVALNNSHGGWLGRKPQTIFLLGFDLYGVGTGKKLHNNIYKDTENYWATDRHAVPHHYWEYQMSKIFEHYSHVNFFQVNSTGWKIPKQWRQWVNFNFITIDEFSQFIVNFQQQKILKNKEAIIHDLKRRI
tara:strand:+ start:627 stop:1346 length:720 start_codon:yes stop_codon:yes gene_type:complete